jgi:hypothetical protein
MAGELPAPGTLEKWMLDVERALRDLATGNALNKGSVQKATGEYVTLSALAFGAAQATVPALLTLTGTANTGPGQVGFLADVGPSVNVLVTGGALRVDVAASLVASGNHASMFMSYAILGPGDPADPGQATVTQIVQLVGPAFTRAIELQHNAQGQDIRGAFGTFVQHTGLAPGWYTVSARYAMAYSGFTAVPFGSAENRRLMATPF